MALSKVFVVDAESKPLLPTHPARARKLLRTGKAVVYRVIPFTIQLTRVVSVPVGSLTIGIDDGAKEVGIAVVNEYTQEVVFAGVIHLRQDVRRKMSQRAAYRRSRRQRKTRYRQARFNRNTRASWLSPTIRQKKDSIVRVVKDLRTIMPIHRGIIEEGQFDVSSLAGGHQLVGAEYQMFNYAGRNFREKVLWRDRYVCQRCGNQKRLQAHHIRSRSDGGTNTPQNGITLCESCHDELHRRLWTLLQSPKTFEYPAHLQLGKRYLREQLGVLGLDISRCLGWMTRDWRKKIGLAKSHINDAIAIICHTEAPRILCPSYTLIPKRKKVWQSNPTKTCIEKQGFRHWDVVKAQHRSKGIVVGSIRSLKANRITLRTGWDNNFPVAYRQTRLLWRFRTIVYITNTFAPYVEKEDAVQTT